MLVLADPSLSRAAITSRGQHRGFRAGGADAGETGTADLRRTVYFEQVGKKVKPC